VAVTPDSSHSVGEALASFYAAQGLPDIGVHTARYWRIELRPLSIPMPNFGWRRRALPIHDLHHVVTGYPCTPVGEFEMAAWEFAAGRYPHPGATAFCLPLVGAGAVLAPRRTWHAWLRGRSSRTLYAQGLTPAILSTELGTLRRAFVPGHLPAARSRDRLAYAALVAVSLTWTLAPLVVAVAILRFA
jgi:hypothetical protein